MKKLKRQQKRKKQKRRLKLQPLKLLEIVLKLKCLQQLTKQQPQLT
jgi:hypothetical protein